ncbi:hemolysin XhlA family protein [Ezakiella peruensis]|uniref:hemolysin XhlA family protein n=1 Tax=Ezakiella peruensis TaxID=1464038 RepID=UPI000C1B3134|nr:hemolysin XhlA family protein [Ezakiella peruensis]
MDDKQCEIYRDRVNERLQIQDKRLDNHSERLDKLENYKYMIDERINNLIAKMDDLMGTMKWLTRGVGTAIIGLIVYIIQQFLLNR